MKSEDDKENIVNDEALNDAISDPSREKSIQTLREWASKGSYESACVLAEWYSIGVGVDIDLRIAEKWWERAAQINQLDGQYLLARFLLANDKTEEARGAFLKSATLGHIPSTSFLGMMYASGKGGERNTELGESMLLHAYRSGNIPAGGFLGKVLLRNGAIFRKIYGLGLLTKAFFVTVFIAYKEGGASSRLY